MSAYPMCRCGHAVYHSAPYRGCSERGCECRAFNAPRAECDYCNAPAPRKSDGTPRYPTHHGSSVGLCQECAREAISL